MLIRQVALDEYAHKGKGIRFIVLYPPERSHDLPILGARDHLPLGPLKTVDTPNLAD